MLRRFVTPRHFSSSLRLFSTRAPGSVCRFQVPREDRVQSDFLRAHLSENSGKIFRNVHGVKLKHLYFDLETLIATKMPETMRELESMGYNLFFKTYRNREEAQSLIELAANYGIKISDNIAFGNSHPAEIRTKDHLKLLQRLHKLSGLQHPASAVSIYSEMQSGRAAIYSDMWTMAFTPTSSLTALTPEQAAAKNIYSLEQLYKSVIPRFWKDHAPHFVLWDKPKDLIEAVEHIEVELDRGNAPNYVPEADSSLKPR